MLVDCTSTKTGIVANFHQGEECCCRLAASVMQCGEKSAMLCGAGAGPRWGRGKLRNCFKLLLLQGEAGEGGAAAGLQRYPLGALQKLRYLDIGHRGNEQYLILSFSLFYLDMYKDNFCHIYYNSIYPGLCLRCSLAVSAGRGWAGHS